MTADVRVNVLIIVSDVVVDLSMGGLADVIFDVLNNIGVDVLVDVIVNVFSGVMTAFEFAMPDPLEEIRC